MTACRVDAPKWRKWIRTTVLATAGLLTAVASHADTYPRQPGVDAVHYVFRLTIDDSSDRIAGEATITFRLAERVGEVSLDLTSEADGKGMTVSAVTVGGRSVPFRHAADRLHIPLPSVPRSGEEVCGADLWGSGARVG
jgi:hypothetical protein